MGKNLKFTALGVLTLALLAMILAACAAPTPAALPLSVEVNASSDTVEVGQQVSIVTNSSSQITSYKWTVNRGTISSKTDPAVIYTAPQSPGQDIVTLVVEGPGGTVTKSVPLTVVLPPSTATPVPPVVTVEGSSPVPPPPPSSPIPTGVECDGNSSAEYIAQAWVALGAKNYERLQACAQGAIDGWTAEANQQQANQLHANRCDTVPAPSELDSYYKSNWALSDIGTGWYLRGRAYAGMNDVKAARAAYQTVIDQYSCAYTWDPNGFFWRVQDAAKKDLAKLPAQ